MTVLTASPRTALRVTVCDDGRAVHGLAAALEADWMCRVGDRSGPPELAVQVIRHLEPFSRTSRWIWAEIPHLLIRFTDEAALVGPLVAARGAPCHSCEALTLVEEDPGLPDLVAQRYGTIPRSETGPVGALVSAVAAHLVRHWLAGSTAVHRTQIAIPVRDGLAAGTPAIREISPHRECGCSFALTPSVAAAT